MSELEMAGATSSTSYGTYFNDHYTPVGTPQKKDLERYMENPQEYSDEIIALAKYYYCKDGLIMRTVNIMRDFGVTDLRLEYHQGRSRVQGIIERYNERVGIVELIRDIIFEMALTGNCAIYDRDGERVDIFPLSVIDVSPLIVNGKPELLFSHDAFSLRYDFLHEMEREELLQAYPKEVREGVRDGKRRIVLHHENAYFLKANCSRYEKYGVTFLLPAFGELAQKNLLKQAEKSTASGIIDQVLHVKVGNKDHAPTQKEIDFYNGLFTGHKGALRIVTPHYVSAEWVSPNTSIFGEEKFSEIDKDLLSSLGVSLTLLRGEGGGNYAEGMLNMAGLIRTITTIREQIPPVLRGLYKAELRRHGIGEDKCPKVSFGEIVIDKGARASLVQWLFQNAGLPYEVLFEEMGYDYASLKLMREGENRQDLSETFSLHDQPFQGQKEAGAPKKPLHERISDPAQSNNEQPRTGLRRPKEVE